MVRRRITGFKFDGLFKIRLCVVPIPSVDRLRKPSRCVCLGKSLTWGDFNNDGMGDLAIGVWNEDVGTVQGAGAVNVLYGSMTAAPPISSNGTPTTRSSLAADLAVGIPNQNVGSVIDAGAVNVIYGSVSGLAPLGNRSFNQNSTGVPGVAEEDDHFGGALY